MNDALHPLVLGIDHVGVAVPDLNKAIEFYTTTFGFRCTHIETNTEQGVQEAMLHAGDSDGTAIQLLAPLSDDSVIGRFIGKKGPGIQQIAYRVSNVDEAAETLRSKGITVLYPQAQRGTANSRVNFVHPKDTGGVLVELVEPASI